MAVRGKRGCGGEERSGSRRPGKHVARAAVKNIAAEFNEYNIASRVLPSHIRPPSVVDTRVVAGTMSLAKRLSLGARHGAFMTYAEKLLES